MNKLRAEGRYAALFLAVFLFSVGVFFAYALFRTVYFSFTDYNLFDTPRWVGLRNYTSLFGEPLFLTALRNTLAFAFVVTTVQTFLALVLAALLNQKVRGITVFRTVFYLPSVLSSAAVTLIFLWLYQRGGFINFAVTWALQHSPYIVCFLSAAVALQTAQVFFERRRGLPAAAFDPALLAMAVLLAAVLTLVLGWAGALSPRAVTFEQVWLNTSQTFLGLPVPLWAIMLQNIFTTIPTFMLLFLAGLQDVPDALYEAAAIDGATTVQQFFNVTVPTLRPVTFLVVTLSLIGTLQLFDQVALFGSAAPLESRISLAYYVFLSAFPEGGQSEIGLSSAAALVLAMLTLLIVLLQRRFGISDRGYA